MLFDKPAALGDYLSAIVPVLIHEIAIRRGPTTADYVRLFTFNEQFTEFGADNMMFPGKTQKERREGGRLWGELAFAVAVMAYQPAGIRDFCGVSFSAGAPDITGKRTPFAGLFCGTQQLLNEFWDTGGKEEIYAAWQEAVTSRPWPSI